MFKIHILQTDRIESEIKRDENTMNDISEKLEIVSNANMVTK